MRQEHNEWLVQKKIKKILELDLYQRLTAIESLAESDPHLALQVSLAWQIGNDSTERITEAESVGQTIDEVGEIKFFGETINGGMGEVRIGKFDGETVAVKTLPRSFRAVPSRVERFQRECDVLTRLYHPNIVELKSVSPSGDSFVMAYIEGKNAEEWRRTENCSPQVAAKLVLDVAKAVGYAHGLGIIHRDIKPQNVVIEEQAATAENNGNLRPILIDFGIAFLEDETSDLTLAPLGTRLYMAPEQFRGEDATKSSDIYGLGGLLYFLVTGVSPYDGEYSDADSIRKLVTDLATTPPTFAKRGVACPSDLETICRRCLAKSTGGRFGSAEELIEDLERWLRGATINSSPESIFKRSSRFVKRNRIAIAIAATLMAFASITTVFWSQANVAKSRYADSANGMLTVLNTLAQSVGQESLLKSPQLSGFRNTLLNAYLDNHMTVRFDLQDDRLIGNHLNSIVAVASTARETGELRIARQLIEDGHQILSEYPHFEFLEPAFNLRIEESRVDLTSEDYRKIQQQNPATVDLLDQSNLPSRELMKADLLSDLAWSQYFVGEIKEGWHSAAEELRLRLLNHSAESDSQQVVKLALAHNSTAYIARKSWKYGVETPSRDYVRDTLNDGVTLLDEWPVQSDDILAARGHLNNTLGLLFKLQPDQQEAMRIHRENIEIYRSLIQNAPMILEHRIGLARAQGNLADCLHKIADDENCALERATAVREYEKIIDDFDRQKEVVTEYSIHAVRLHYSLLRLKKIEQASQLATAVSNRVSEPHVAELNSYQRILCAIFYANLSRIDPEGSERWAELRDSTFKEAKALSGFEDPECKAALEISPYPLQ